MKKNLIRVVSLLLAALLLLLPLSACGGRARTLDDLPETDELVIYLPQSMYGFDGIDRYLAQDYVIPFREMQSEAVRVKLVVVPGSLEEYEERVTSEVVAGGGPDILFLRLLPHMDIEKAARNYSFYDLTDLLASDPDFHEEDYVDGILDAVKIDGRQYTMPLTYTSPVYLSDERRLAELGFDWDEIHTTSDFMEELARVTPLAAENEKFLQMLMFKNSFGELLDFSGIRLLDYEDQKVLPDEAAFRKFMESYKSFYPFDYEEPGMQPYWKSPTWGQWSDFEQGNLIFFYAQHFHETGYFQYEMASNSVTTVFGTLPGQNGESVGVIMSQIAINGSSENVLNAYRFMKTLISESGQNTYEEYIKFYQPVRKDVVHDIVYGGNGLRGLYDVTDEEKETVFRQYTELDRYVWKTSDMALTMTWDAMLPYLKDEKSYDDCLSELQRKLTFYLSE